MIAYVARELDTGRTLAAHEDVQLPAYSTIKVLLAAAFWRLVARGELDEAQPCCFEPGTCVGGSGVLRGLRHAATLSLADVMHLALVVSDNDATNVIADPVGFERVNALADELGLRADAHAAPDDGRRGRGGRPRQPHLGRRPRAAARGRSPEARRSSRSSASGSSPRSSSRSTSTASPATCRRRPATRASAATTRRLGRLRARLRARHRPATGGPCMVVMTRDSGGFEAVARTGAALYSALGEGRDRALSGRCDGLAAQVTPPGAPRAPAPRTP